MLRNGTLGERRENNRDAKEMARKKQKKTKQRNARENSKQQERRRGAVAAGIGGQRSMDLIGAWHWSQVGWPAARRRATLSGWGRILDCDRPAALGTHRHPQPQTGFSCPRRVEDVEIDWKYGGRARSAARPAGDLWLSGACPCTP